MSKPGIRLSLFDALVLLLATAAACWLWPKSVRAASLVMMVVGHFFVFCNIFRVPTRLELLWGLSFVVNIVGSSWAGMLTTATYIYIQIPITLVVIGWTVRLPNYHGIAWSRINPGLVWDKAGDGVVLSERN